MRIAKELFLARNLPPLGVNEMHVSHHMCWPWDLDFAMELNNGRTLTLLDLGRLPLAGRFGLFRMMRTQKWGLTMAGVTVRYRRRIRMFERFKMRSRVVGWDARFVYIEQSMWKRSGECANHALYRVAVTDSDGIVSTARLAEALDMDPQSPPLADWVQAWIDADAQRIWPPEKS